MDLGGNFTVSARSVTLAGNATTDALTWSNGNITKLDGTLAENVTSSIPEQEPEDVEGIIIWVTSCVVFIIVVFFLTTLLWYRKKKSKPKHKRKARIKKNKEIRAETHRRIRTISRNAIQVEDFLSHYNTTINDPKTGSLPYELRALEQLSNHTGLTTTVGLQSYNAMKNFSPLYIPYDHFRVCLEPIDDDSTTDYINASYVYKTYIEPTASKTISDDGQLMGYDNLSGDSTRGTSSAHGSGSTPSSSHHSPAASDEDSGCNNGSDAGSRRDTGRKAYIAAQGPLRSTVCDFWRMIWQEKCRCIVMLTNLFTYTGKECENYWDKTYYDDIRVRLDKSENLMHYTTRTFTVTKVESEETRVIQQFQFHGLTTVTLPEDIISLLQFRRKIRGYTDGLTVETPTLVHCDSGSERTGAYLALDLTLEIMEKGGPVDLLNTILSIKQFRPRLLTKTVLLKAIYNAIYLHIKCGKTVIHLDTAGSQQLSSDGTIKWPAEVEHEYKIFKELIPDLKVGDCAAGHQAENKHKSRDIMVQPPERARPHLLTFSNAESSDFINAVYVDGFKYSNQYIVGQWPVRASINDFWRLALDDKIAFSVVLHDIHSSSTSYPTFWPTTQGSADKYGPVSVSLVKAFDDEFYSTRTFHVKKYIWNSVVSNKLATDYVTMKLIFIKQWPEHCKTFESWEHIVKLMNICHRQSERQASNFRSTFVMSRDGVHNAGLYCALSICTQQLSKDKEVDIFKAVKTVKQNRPKLVTKAEYLLLYRVIEKMLKERLLLSKNKTKQPTVASLDDEGRGVSVV